MVDEKELLEGLDRIEEGMKCIQEMLGDPEMLAEIKRRLETGSALKPPANKRPFTDRIGKDDKPPSTGPQGFPLV